MSHAARVEGALLHPAAPLMASIYSYGYIDADSFFATKESVKTQFAACFKIYKVIGISFQIVRMFTTVAPFFCICQRNFIEWSLGKLS